MSIKRGRAAASAAITVLLLVVAGCGSSSSMSTSASTSQGSASATTASRPDQKKLRLAYLSFAVANPYDAPMLAAAKAAAKANNAEIVVFDANNDPNTQFSQLQNVIAPGKQRYDGVIVQPIFGAALVKLAQSAVDQGLKVGNVDQVLGTDFTTGESQVKGLGANVIFVPVKNGTKMGEQTVAACQAKKTSGACSVGYLYGVKASTVDKALRSGFDKAIAADPNIKVVAKGEGLYSTQGGLDAAQNMLQANPNLDIIVGADQSIAGARQAIKAAGKQVQTVGTGGSALGLQAVKAGDQVASVMQLPATEGGLVVEDLVKAIRTGQDQPSREPAAQLPQDGVATKANVSKFNGEWPG
jgi:ribose transport system substrate-binding protein